MTFCGEQVGRDRAGVVGGIEVVIVTHRQPVDRAAHAAAARAVVAAVARLDEDRRVGRRAAAPWTMTCLMTPPTPPSAPASPSPPAPERIVEGVRVRRDAEVGDRAADRGEAAVARLDAAVGRERADRDLVDVRALMARPAPRWRSCPSGRRCRRKNRTARRWSRCPRGRC